MSLVVWLPLTKDLRQQGLSNITVTNNGATFNSAGKLGGCYSFNDNYIQTNYNFYPGTNDFSISCWFYLTENTSKTYQHICSFKSAPAASAGIAMSYNRIQQKFLWGTADGSNSAEVWSADTFPTSTIYNTWHHLVMVRDKNDAKHGYFYLDGIRKELASVPTILNITTNANKMKIGSCGELYSTYYWTGKLNDFRLYDHALSQMEVKELAKGLVLHYPLNRQGWGQENLGNTSATYSNQTNGQTISASGWGGDAGTVTCYYSGGYNNYPYKVYHKTATGSGGIYYKTANDIDIKANTTYTMSVYIKASRNFLGDPYSFNINRGNDNYYINFGQSMQFTTEWKRITKTFTTDANAAGKYGEMSIIYDDTAVDYYIYYSGFKIEEGSIATPWCPNSSDALATTMGLNSTTEYDCSGFCNNAQSNGNISLTYSSDTPKYSVSTVFASGARIATPVSASTFMPRDAITVNIWFKSSAAVNRFLSCTEGGGFNFESNSGNIRWILYAAGKGYNTCNSSTTWASVSDNTWHMLTGTCDKTNMKIYLDGELIQTTACTYPDTAFGYASTTPFTLGAEAQTIASPIAGTYVGNLSDCRIYATALSADDVKSLYQNSAYIDSSGNVYGAVHTEV